MKDSFSATTLIEVKRLFLSSPETVYQYLKEHKGANLVHHLSEVLLTRDDELINLAIAQFSKNMEVLEKLFHETRDEAIRCAILGNPKFPWVHWGLSDDQLKLSNIIKTGTDAEVDALVRNSSLRGHLLADIFSHKGWAASLDDDRWFLCCLPALFHPNLHSEYKSLAPVGYSHGWEGSQHDTAIQAAWNLLLEAPLAKKWANNLSNIFSRQMLRHPYGANEDFFKNVFTRWVSESEDLKESFKDLRMWIGSCAPSNLKGLQNWMAKHEDQAIRIGHYYSFRCVDPSELDASYKKDGQAFIDAALRNDNLYKDEKVREHFRELVERNCEKRTYWDDLDSFDIIFGREAKIHPEILPEDERDALEPDKPLSITLSRRQHEELKQRIEDLENHLMNKLSERRGIFGA